jgi:hypothetical protein
MAQVWVKTNNGDIMRLGDAQKARKVDEDLTYEVIGKNDGRGWETADSADPRLHAGSGKVQGDAGGGAGPDGRKPSGGEHSDEDVGGVGEKARRPRGRPRRNA